MGQLAGKKRTGWRTRHHDGGVQRCEASRGARRAVARRRRPVGGSEASPWLVDADNFCRPLSMLAPRRRHPEGRTGARRFKEGTMGRQTRGPDGKNGARCQCKTLFL